MKTPYQEMREKASDLIEKQRKAADLRAELYRQKLEEEAKEKQRKKNSDQATSRAIRCSPQSNSDATLDVVVLDMLSEPVGIPHASLTNHYSPSRSNTDYSDATVRPVETVQTPSQSSSSSDNSYSSSSSSSSSSDSSY